MKKQFYTFGTLALALVMSGVPMAAFAESKGGDADGSVGVGIQARTAPISVDARVTATADLRGEKGSESATSSRAGGDDRIVGSASTTARVRGEIEDNDNVSEQGREHSRSAIFSLEGTTTPVFSLEQLKKSIQTRKQELDEEASSSTSTDHRTALEDANPVRLAVHTLLASKDLLGGIGQQVSVIAHQMNDSVATTSVAEVKIKTRGFLTRLFFGGDSASAQAISNAVAQDQARIDQLTQLLNQADISADLKITLQAQITALQEAQTKLKALAQKEKSSWGLFSWRF